MHKNGYIDGKMNYILQLFSEYACSSGVDLFVEMFPIYLIFFIVFCALELNESNMQAGILSVLQYINMSVCLI